MKQLGRVTSFALGQGSSYDVGPGLAALAASLHKKGKIACLCRCLWPFYIVRLRKNGTSFLAFLDAYNKSISKFSVTDAQTLQKINEDIITLSETSEIGRAILNLHEMEKHLQSKEQTTVEALVNNEATEILANLSQFSKVEDVSRAVHLEPSVDEKEIVESARKLLSIFECLEIADSISSMANSVQTAILERFQKIIDDAFVRLNIWKTNQMNTLNQNLRGHETYLQSLQKGFQEVQLLLDQNSTVVNAIDSQISQARASMQNADASDNYQLGFRVSELQRERERSIRQRDAFLLRRGGLQNTMRRENDIVSGITLEVQRTRNYLPADLKKNADDLEKFKAESEVFLEELSKTYQNLKAVWNCLAKTSGDLEIDDATEYQIGNETVDVCLMYVPVYLSQVKRFLGLRKSFLAVSPCTLPSARQLINNDALSEYFARAIPLMPKSDWKTLKKAVKENNILKQKAGREVVEKGKSLILEQRLITGLES